MQIEVELWVRNLKSKSSEGVSFKVRFSLKEDFQWLENIKAARKIELHVDVLQGNDPLCAQHCGCTFLHNQLQSFVRLNKSSIHRRFRSIKVQFMSPNECQFYSLAMWVPPGSAFTSAAALYADSKSRSIYHLHRGWLEGSRKKGWNCRANMILFNLWYEQRGHIVRRTLSLIIVEMACSHMHGWKELCMLSDDKQTFSSDCKFWLNFKL